MKYTTGEVRRWVARWLFNSPKRKSNDHAWSEQQMWDVAHMIEECPLCTDLPLKAFATFYLQESGKITESFAAKLLETDVITYRLKREQAEAEMAYVLSAETSALQTGIIEKAASYKPMPPEARGDISMARSMNPRHQDWRHET